MFLEKVRHMAERAASRASPCTQRRETHKQGRHGWHPASSQGNCVSLSCSSPASSYLSGELTCPPGNPAEKRFLLCRGAGPGSFTDSLRKSGVIAIVFLYIGMCSPPACAPGVRPWELRVWWEGRQKPGGVRHMAERAASRASPCAQRRETHKQGRHR